MGGAKVLKQVDISSAEVGAWACRTEAPAAPQAGPRRFGAGASARLQPYRVQWETEREHDPVFLREWRSLLAASSGPEPIYQSPEFLQYIRATSQDPAEVEILTVRDAGDGRLLALTPIRYRDLAIGL